MSFRAVLALGFVLLAACDAGAGAGHDGRDLTTTAARTATPAIVDSILPPEEELRRFRHGLVAPAALEGGATSREALIAGFVQALETRDTARLREMHVTRAEFAWIWFPESRFAREPYRTRPGFLWGRTLDAGSAGTRRLFRRFGGALLPPGRFACGAPEREGANRLWTDCTYHPDAARGGIRIFGSILERDGRFKFLSYANDL